MSDPRHLLGQQAEEATAAWLAASGWTILARRWRRPEGELDLVCRDPGGVLVGVEVKLRRRPRVGDPLESVDRRRIRRLRAALGSFASREGPTPTGLRIDLVAVTPAVGARWRLARYASIDAW